MKYYVGIDLGGTNIAAGVVDETGKILCKCSRRCWSSLKTANQAGNP